MSEITLSLDEMVVTRKFYNKTLERLLLLKAALIRECECVDFYADRYKWNGGYFDKSDKEELHGRTIGGKRARETVKLREKSWQKLITKRRVNDK